MTTPALVICDVWDTHWCATARAQAEVLAPRINRFASSIRRLGGVIIHAPSQTDPFYEASEPYRRGRAAAVPLVEQRARPTIEIPTYDSCPCTPPCTAPDVTSAEWPWPWRRQHSGIDIAEDDVVTGDDGDVVFGVVRRAAATPVAICGLHLDECILNRPFGAKALWAAGVDVVILEDLTEPTHPDDRSLVLDRVAAALPVVSSAALRRGHALD